MLRQLGRAIGYAATIELTTREPEVEGRHGDEYYDHLDATPGPMVAIMRHRHPRRPRCDAGRWHGRHP